MGEFTEKFAHLADTVARDLLGEPTTTNTTELRFGSRGSLCVHIGGQSQGTFRNSENNESGDLVDLVVRFKGGNKGEAISWLESLCGGVPPSVRPILSAAPQQKVWSSRAESIWVNASPLAGTLGEPYLDNRSCFVPDVEDLKFLPQTDKYPPALAARVTDFETGAPMTLHFIQIDPNSQKQLQKKFLKDHKSGGGVVRLCPLGPDLSAPFGLAEGIENALSVIWYGQSWMVDFKIGPVWAAITAGNLGKLNKPPLLGDLVIWPDKGTAGMKAANSLAERWTGGGATVRIIPPKEEKDWNDDLVRECQS